MDNLNETLVDSFLNLGINQKLVNKVKSILYNLEYKPTCFPIDNYSIMLEFENDENHLWFNINLNDMTFFYCNSMNYNTPGINGKIFSSEINEDAIYDIVKSYYTKSGDEFIKYIEKY